MATDVHDGSSIDVSISIVSMNNIRDLEECIGSIVGCVQTVRYEIIVVAYRFNEENLHELRVRFPQTRVVLSNDLRGYSANHNLALRLAGGRYVFILNDDIIFESDIVSEMVRFLDENPRAAGGCPTLRNPDGSNQLTCRREFTPLRFLKMISKIDRNNEVRMSPKLDDLAPREMEVGSGAAFMVRKVALDQISYLDEEYFLAPDDVDWSRRIRAAGWKLIFFPNLHIIHKGSKTVTKFYPTFLPTLMAGWYAYFHRYYGLLTEALVRFASLLISVVYFSFWCLRRLFKGDERAKIMMSARKNVIRYALARTKSTEIFRTLYSRQDKEEHSIRAGPS